MDLRTLRGFLLIGALSACSAEGSATFSLTETPGAGDLAPGTVTDLAVAGTSETSLTLSWTQVGDGAGLPASYAIRHDSPSLTWSDGYSTETTVSGDAIDSELQHEVTGLTPGTTYEFQLVAYRGTLDVDAVFGELSNLTSGSTQSSSTPTALTAGSASASAGNGSVSLSSSSATGGTAPYSYQWHRSTTGGFSPGSGTVLAGLTTRSATDSDVTNGTTYYYRLVASDSEGASVTYNQVSATPTADAGTAFYADGFESYAVGQSLNGEGDGSFAWGEPLYADVTDELAYTGGRALKFYYGPTEPNGNSHWWSEQRFNLGRNTNELWLEWYIYLPDGTEGVGSARYQHTNTDGGSSNNKFLALWADSYQSEPLAIIELWQHGSGPAYGSMAIQARTEGNNDGDSDLIRRPRHDPPTTLNNGLIVPDNSSADLGRWIQIRYHHKVSDIGANNGEFHLWKDGALVISIENDPFWDEAEANNFIRNGYLLGYDNGRFAENTWIYIDDFKVYSSNPGW